MVLDLEGKVTYWSPSAEKLFGYSREEVKGKVLDLFNEIDQSTGSLRLILAEAMNTGRWIGELNFSGKNGSGVCETTIAPFLDKGGKVEALMVIACDVTEKKKAEQALRESEERYRTVIEVMEEGILIHDEIGTLTTCNRSAEKILGTTADQIIKLVKEGSSWELLQEDGTILANDNLPTQFSLKTGLAQSNRIVGLRRPDKSLIWLSVNSMPLYLKGKKNPSAVVASFTDITEQKKNQEAIQTYARQQTTLAKLGQQALEDIPFQQFLEATTKLVCECLKVTSCKIFEFIPEEDKLLLIAKYGAKGLHRQRITIENLKLSNTLLQSEQTEIFELDATDSHSKEFSLLFSRKTQGAMSSKILSSGRPFGLINVSTENERIFTESDTLFLQSVANVIGSRFDRKVAEENLAKLLERTITAQEEEKRWISRELHDEAGQMLTSLLVGLRMIADSKDIEDSRQHANRLRQIASKAIEDLGRLARGLRPMILDDIGLLEALKSYIDDYSKTHKIEVTLQYINEPKRLPSVVEISIYRIAQEALTNTAKHAKATKVDLFIAFRAHEIEFSIKDNGCGFDAESVVSRSGSRNRLGIYGMRERVLLLAGTFKILSEISKGTEIIVRIPV